MTGITDLNAFASRTSYAIPVLDYAVGLKGTPLKNAHTLPSSGAVSFNVKQGVAYIDGNNAHVTGYDFSGMTVIVRGSNVQIDNCKFDAAVGCIALRQMDNASGLSIDHCLFDGLKSTQSNYGSMLVGGVGKLTVTNSEFKNTPQDVLQIANGTLDHNYIHDVGYIPGAHADGIWVNRSTGLVTITNNFIDVRHADGSTVDANSALRITSEGGANTSGVHVQNNVLLGGTYTIGGFGSTPTADIKGLVIEKNMIGGNWYGNFYAGTGSANVVYSNNVDTPQDIAPSKTLLGSGNNSDKILANVKLWGETVEGTKMNDYMVGSGHDDVLHAGEGRDVLVGARGKDIFLYKSASESSAVGKGDAIFNFEHGVDKIDLRQIDADTRLAGKQGFAFVGDKGFSGLGHELHVTAAGAGTWVVEFDSNGDKKADFVLEVHANQVLTATDFLL